MRWSRQKNVKRMLFLVAENKTAPSDDPGYALVGYSVVS